MFWHLVHDHASLTEAQRLQHIRHGLSWRWVESVRDTFRISGPGFVELFNISLSTYERKKKADQALDLVTSERLDRLASVAVLAEQVFEDKDAAAQWLERPNQALGGQTPLSLCDTEIGANQVRRVLHALEWGGAA
ncbi:toxin-antitoxin system antitoxin component [Pseudomonas citronellolis]|nr:toxin-antitoxin system antitoxin component [Pseudomonas citronellolis]